MTEEERETFIKDKVVPLLDGMKFSEACDLVYDLYFEKKWMKYLYGTVTPPLD